MGFLNNNKKEQKPKDAAYFEATEEKVAVRPGAKVPSGVWVHQIHEVVDVKPNGEKVTIRRYKTELCTSTGRNGSGCRMCSMKDPLWSRLPPEKRTNKKQQRTDFPKRVIHILPVFNHKLGVWQILKGGNQVYEQMDTWYDSQPSEELKDLRRCDWVVSAEGQKMRKKYTTTRLDATPHTFTPEDEVEVQRLLKKANDDLAPVSHEEFLAMVNGDVQADDVPDQQVTVPQSLVESPPWIDEKPLAPQVAAVTSQPKPVEQAKPVQADNSKQAALVEFTSWLNQQPESKDVGMVRTIIPLIKEFNGGDINYYSMDAGRLSELKNFLATKLGQLRTK